MLIVDYWSDQQSEALSVTTQGPSLFQPVRRSRVSTDIVRQIQDLIAAEDLQPGDRLPGERELADALSVSRQSVREALRVLDYLGVVVVRPGEGTFVATTPPAPVDASLYSLLSERSFLLDLLEARRILEEGIVHLAARRATTWTPWRQPWRRGRQPWPRGNTTWPETWRFTRSWQS